MSEPQPIPVLLDVDTGIDDAMAIALALRLDEIDLVGVTTVAGNVGVSATTDNTLRVLSWLGGAAVPVSRGMAGPLSRKPFHAADIHGETGLGGMELPPSSSTVTGVTAPEFIVRTARARAGELILICTGPLTNLAVALSLEPELPALASRMVVMGGAFTVPGNVTPAAEFNAFVDPEAADAIARGAFQTTFIGLDVTHQVPLTRAEWLGLEEASSPEAQLIAGVCRHTFAGRGMESAFLHDPLAVAVAARPDLVACERSSIVVDTGLAGGAGQTLLVRESQRPRHEVALRVDASRFMSLFRRALQLPSR